MLTLVAVLAALFGTLLHVLFLALLSSLLAALPALISALSLPDRLAPPYHCSGSCAGLSVLHVTLTLLLKCTALSSSTSVYLALILIVAPITPVMTTSCDRHHQGIRN